MDSSEKAWLTYALGRQAESSFLMIHVHFSHSTNRRDGSAKSETRFVGLRDGDHYSKASCLRLCSVSLKRMRERAECVVKIVCRVYVNSVLILSEIENLLVNGRIRLCASASRTNPKAFRSTTYQD